MAYAYNIKTRKQFISLTEAKAGIYPNPVHDKLTISLDKEPKQARMEIADVTGRVVYTSELVNTVTTINTESITPGLYFIKLYEGKKPLAVKKLVKE
jgi:hypothetical protein